MLSVSVVHSISSLQTSACCVHSKCLINIFILINTFWFLENHRDEMLYLGSQVLLVILLSLHTAPKWFSLHRVPHSP